jgi:hypothetical protein
MTRAATASDHHQPRLASRSRLANVAEANAAPARLRIPSPRRAELCSGPASLSFALASTGKTSTDAALRTIPSVEWSGTEWLASSVTALAIR